MRTFKICSVFKLKDLVQSKIDNYDHFSRYAYKSLTRQIEKDLSKVEFDCENLDDGPRGYVDQSSPVDIDRLLGYKVLSNGLAFLGIVAGGDWEMPVFFIIYFDGHKLRGYIPEKGNTWNKKTKSAYGNDDTEADDAPDFNVPEILQDIEDRIKAK